MENKSYLFDEWWLNLLDRWTSTKDGYDVIDRATKQFMTLKTSEREDYLDGLVRIIQGKQKGDTLAIEIIKGNAREEDLNIIANLSKKYLKYKNIVEESYLVSLLRVLTKGGTNYHQIVNSYLYNSPLPKYYSSLQWSFWPEYADEFVKAYSYYLDNEDAKTWVGTAIVQAFMTKPDALICLKEQCSDKEWYSEKGDVRAERALHK